MTRFKALVRQITGSIAYTILQSLVLCFPAQSSFLRDEFLYSPTTERYTMVSPLLHSAALSGPSEMVVGALLNAVDKLRLCALRKDGVVRSILT